MRRMLPILFSALVACAAPEAPLEEAPNPPAALPLPEGAVEVPAGDIRHHELITSNLLGSLRPNEQDIPEIKKRGRLVVGVDQSQNLLSFRDPATGELSGFEISLAKEIARDIFGDPEKVEFRFVDSASWIQALEEQDVDCVIRSVSITRDRQDQVFFSTPYLTGDTQLLSERNSGIEQAEDIGEGTVCAAEGATGVQRIAKAAPDSTLLIVRSSADCLLALQQNQADAIVSDNTILSGMVAQDPLTQIVGDPLARESYGVAFAKPGARHKTEGLIRQVNVTLERIFRDGTWEKMFEEWFGAYLPPQDPPALNYRKEQP
ncbi:ABC transporter substrate-binding protein [Corynebacterium pelargi]|uniref:ABC transporter glutamine-binding protein GlnH n=2 Tax=Corynebacterium pelargi TaxID=1471400 RepID=A0A410W6U3_9CORY|nr:glutamate ABC transporter substrate-binding protein [Corynebacterium pelargi]QAU51594.1 ABC transporter glutamine-binding protein GlnH precursor [Corynebacterium pelargi]GGG79903.1 ABC transporter substrate-binding protein [Corynebacterium pelargi]